MAHDRVEAVERALTVLEVFDSNQTSFSLAELAQLTGYYKSTLLRLLASLERFGYAQRGEDGRWRMGGTPLRLARRHPPSRDLAMRVQPVLDELARHSGETASLLALSDSGVLCRLVALPDQPLRHDLSPGTEWPCHEDGNPGLEMKGGEMLCLALEPNDDLGLWLALSGPSGRLDPTHCVGLLEAAISQLQTGHQTADRQATVQKE